MQKLTKTELYSIICELRNSAGEFSQMALETENYNIKSFLRLRAKNLNLVAKKLCVAIENGDNRIAILDGIKSCYPE